MDTRQDNALVTFCGLRSREALSFGAMYMAAVLERGGMGVRVLLVKDTEELVRRFLQNPTPVAAFSITTGLHRYYLSWAKALKRRLEVHTVFGGPHPTYFPEFIETPYVDALCTGEGEEAFYEYMKAFMENRNKAPSAPVQGFVHRFEGEILDGGFRPPVADLDSLPSPRWELFYDQNPVLARHKVKSFLASRGCPYRCSYCFNREWLERHRGTGPVVRTRDPSLVVEEINEVRHRWGARLVWFLDSNLACNKKWLYQFLPIYEREVGLPFFCKIRPNVVTEELAARLADAGCTSVGVGIETGDDRLRNEYLDRHLSKEQILRCCHAFKDLGILVMGFNMMGLPGETYEMALETLQLNVDAGVDYAMTMFFQPYPGTEATRRAVEMGFFDGDFDSLDNSYFNPSPLVTDEPSKRRKLVNLQRLFALAVTFPEVRRLLPLLVKVPENAYYMRLFKTYNHMAFHWWFYRAYERQLPPGKLTRRLSPRFLDRFRTGAVGVVDRILKIEENQDHGVHR